MAVSPQQDRCSGRSASGFFEKARDSVLLFVKRETWNALVEDQRPRRLPHSGLIPHSMVRICRASGTALLRWRGLVEVATQSRVPPVRVPGSGRPELLWTGEPGPRRSVPSYGLECRGSDGPPSSSKGLQGPRQWDPYSKRNR